MAKFVLIFQNKFKHDKWVHYTQCQIYQENSGSAKDTFTLIYFLGHCHKNTLDAVQVRVIGQLVMSQCMGPSIG